MLYSIRDTEHSSVLRAVEKAAAYIILARDRLWQQEREARSWQTKSPDMAFICCRHSPGPFSPSATKAQAEHAISSAGQTITKMRNRLDPNNLDLVSLKHSWVLVDEWRMSNAASVL